MAPAHLVLDGVTERYRRSHRLPNSRGGISSKPTQYQSRASAPRFLEFMHSTISFTISTGTRAIFLFCLNGTVMRFWRSTIRARGRAMVSRCRRCHSLIPTAEPSGCRGNFGDCMATTSTRRRLASYWKCSPKSPLHIWKKLSVSNQMDGWMNQQKMRSSRGGPRVACPRERTRFL